MTDKKRIAVVLFNLGGPNSSEAVKPFLFNLFSDKAIIRLPQPMRWILAKFISSRRAPIAREIYRHMGGKSPIIPQTQAQADALEKVMKNQGGVKCFVSMRYWHPFSNEVVRDVKNFQPDKIILLPLYPQYSTTTSASSLADWHKQAQKIAMDIPTTSVCCYPEQNEFIQAQAELLTAEIKNHSPDIPFRVLFSAHGLPKKIIDAGDPYAWQVEKTVNAVAKKSGLSVEQTQLCYQSRVGRLEWIGPSTEEEIKRAGRDGVALIVVPIAFVSEHSETLVELDIEYAELAKEHGVVSYARVPTMQVQPLFIDALVGLCKAALAENEKICSFRGGRICPREFSGCPN